MNAVVKADLIDGLGITQSLDALAESYISTSGSLILSRLASFGMLSEAASKGIKKYVISAVLDENTCPVCEELDGTEFDVPTGMAQADAIMGADDPNSLKSIAPWPSTSAASVAELADSSPEELAGMGLQIPPYHPGCRCLVTLSDGQEESDSSSATNVTDAASDTDVVAQLAAEAPALAQLMETLLGDLSAESVTAELGGTFDVLEEELGAAIDEATLAGDLELANELEDQLAELEAEKDKESKRQAAHDKALQDNMSLDAALSSALGVDLSDNSN